VLLKWHLPEEKFSRDQANIPFNNKFGGQHQNSAANIKTFHHSNFLLEGIIFCLALEFFVAILINFCYSGISSTISFKLI